MGEVQEIKTEDCSLKKENCTLTNRIAELELKVQRSLSGTKHKHDKECWQNQENKWLKLDVISLKKARRVQAIVD